MTTKQERTMQLVRAAQLGDEQACTALYQETRPRVNSLCVRFDPLEAEDLAQTAWIQIFQKLKTFRGDSLFSTWVHRLVVNHCLMARRRKRLDMVEAVDEEGNSTLENLPEDRNLESQVIACVDIERALPGLAKGYTETLLAHDYLGMEHQEIAQMTGLSIGSSKSQLFKARRKMRGYLQSREKVMETEICSDCKAVGFMDKIAHFRSYQDGKTGKRVEAQCYYHHLGQVPPWMREQAAKKGDRWGSTLELVGKLEIGQNVEVDLPPEASINALRSMLYGAKVTSLSRWSVEKITETRARVTRVGNFPSVVDKQPLAVQARQPDCPKLVSRVEPREADVSQMQIMAKEDYVGKYGAITTKGMHSETQQLWERMQELRFEDVLIIPCPKGMDVQKYRAKLGISVQRLIRMNKPAYKCTLGANVARNWVVLLKQKLETMAATV